VVEWWNGGIDVGEMWDYRMGWDEMMGWAYVMAWDAAVHPLYRKPSDTIFPDASHKSLSRYRILELRTSKRLLSL